MVRNERILNLFSTHPPIPFAYEAATRQFNVGGQHILLENYAEYIQPERSPISRAESAELLTESTLLLNVFDGLYQMPRMYQWLKAVDEGAWRNVRSEVIEVMMDAYQGLSGLDKEHLRTGTHWGFNAGFYRPGHPVFNVLGDCACFGVNPDSHIFGEAMWEQGFSEYSGHNVDTNVQRVSLLAGVGALGAMVGRTLPVQDVLDLDSSSISFAKL